MLAIALQAKQSVLNTQLERIVIIGFGSIGKRHLRLARRLFPRADIRVLRRNHTGETPEFSNGLFTTIDEVRQFSPQLSVISNPATHHIAYAQIMAEIGSHILVEKPLSDNLIGISKLQETCNDKGLVLLLGYNLRFLPSLIKFRTLILSGVIGRIFSVRCEVGQFLPSWRPESDYRLGVSAKKHLGGGVLLELSHEIDYLGWVFGDIRWVSAAINKQSLLEIDVEDTAYLILGFDRADGANDLDVELTCSLNLDFIRHDTTRKCIAIGEHGSLRWDGLTGAVDLFKPGANEWNEVFKEVPERDASYLAEWNHLIEVTSKEVTPLITITDGMKVLRVIEAAQLSSKSGTKIYL